MDLDRIQIQLSYIKSDCTRYFLSCSSVTFRQNMQVQCMILCKVWSCTLATLTVKKHHGAGECRSYITAGNMQHNNLCIRERAQTPT